MDQEVFDKWVAKTRRELQADPLKGLLSSAKEIEFFIWEAFDSMVVTDDEPIWLEAQRFQMAIETVEDNL